MVQTEDHCGASEIRKQETVHYLLCASLAFYVMGFLPDSMLSIILLPIIKDKVGKVNSLDNYRPIALANISRVPTGGTFPDRNLCGCGLERGSVPDPPLRTLSTGSERPPAEEEVL